MGETGASGITVKGRFRTLLAALFAGAALIGLAACGSSDDGSSDSTGNGQKVGGTVACDSQSIQEGVDAWAKAYGGGEKTTLVEDQGAFRCADGWAVAFPLSGEGDKAVEITVVLEAEGQFWIPKDRSKVCGQNAADSEVPKSLYRDGCQTN